MLELVDLDQQIAEEQYEKIFPDLERALGEAHRAGRQAGVPVVALFEGWDAAGKGTLINRLAQAIDPRGFKVHAISAPDQTERFHPWLWRFWASLPAAGEWAIFDRSWYGRVLVERMEQLTPKREWKQAFEDIRQFERQLTDSGVVLAKFWLHISQEEQRRRFGKIGRHRRLAWKVGPPERRQQRRYGQWLAAVEEMLERTSSAAAPWTIVEATHGRWARTKVFQVLSGSVQGELARRASPPPVETSRPEPLIHARPTILERVNLGLAMEQDVYQQELPKLQKRLRGLEHDLYVARVPAVIVYEGWDAAGKGGNIRRVTRGLDPRGYEVVPVAAPSSEEKAQPYLWRFWRRVPKAGHIAIFDRSWYGRVLVERVEGFCSPEEWKRAYEEINEFERQLAEYGTVIVKFWLHISADEQLRRFQQRQSLPYKSWKITDEDWRNREKWPLYEQAVGEMLERTSTAHAPWTILEANCKLHARIKALRTVADALERAVKQVRG